MAYSFEAYYALTPIQAETLAFIEQTYEVETSEDDAPGGICVSSNKMLSQTSDAELLKKLSEKGAALYLAAFSSGDVFYFEYWQNGSSQRTLAYESDSGWIEVTGQPQAWEKQVFFGSPTQIERYLSDLKEELGPESPEYQKTKDLMNRVQANQAVEAGAFLPGISAELSAMKVFQHYQIELPFA